MSASGMPLTLNNGRITRILEGTDSLYTQSITPSTTDADLLLVANGDGETKLGAVGKTTRVLGDLNVDGAETITGGATFNGNVTLGDNSGDSIQIGGGTTDSATLACDLSINNAVDVRFARATGTGVFVLPDGSTGEVGAIRVNSSNEFQWWNGSAWATAGTSATSTLQETYEAGSTITTNATGTDLQFTVSTNGDFDIINGADSWGFNYGAADQLNVVGVLQTMDIDTAGALTLDAGATSNFSTSAGDIDISAAGELDLDGGTSVVVDSGTTMALNATTTLDLDAGGALGINSSGGVINIGTDDIDQAVNVGTVGERTITVGNVVGATGVAVNAGTGGISLASTGTGDITLDSDDTLLLDADGVLELNSSAGVISIGNDADAFGINVGTGAAARTIAIGNTTGATAVNIDAGTGGVSIDTAGASNFTVSGATADLTLGARGATVTLNEAGQTTLSGFTATSLIGSLNELKGEISGVGTWEETADEIIAANDIIALDDTGTNGKIVKANAGTAGQDVVLGVATAGAAAAATVTIQSAGKVSVTTSDAGAWTVGQDVFMSATDGEVTSTPPTAGNVQRVGQSLDTGTAGTRTIALLIGEPVDL